MQTMTRPASHLRSVTATSAELHDLGVTTLMVDESRCDLIIEDVYRINYVTLSIVTLSEPVSSVLSSCETRRCINLYSLLCDFTVNDLVLLAVLGSLGNQDLPMLSVSADGAWSSRHRPGSIWRPWRPRVRPLF